MKKQQWIDKVKINALALRNLIKSYHPVNLEWHEDGDPMSSVITAPNAERACEVVRNLIRQESLNCPEIQFDIAIQKEDSDTIYSLLSAAWFGVPESTECWGINGFSIAIDLLDDPIDEE